MLKRIFWTAILLSLVAPVWYLADLPDTARLRKENPTTSAIRAFRERQSREKGKKPHSVMVWRNLDRISPYLAHAVLLSEDDTFFQHHGFDLAQTKRAMQINWERKRFAFGASTITQQLARSLYLSPRKNLLRKAKEALITRRLEQTLPKKRILELYLNVVEWGPQVYGAEAASQYFFHKPALDLTPEEAISLAAILPSPRRWNPLAQSRFMTRRRSVLYARMLRAHYVTPMVSTEPVLLPSIDEKAPLLEPAAPAEDEGGADADSDSDDAGSD